MTDEWAPSAAALPQKPHLSEEQQEAVRADLFQVGIVDDPFKMTPIKRLEWLSSSRFIAAAVYAALSHAMEDYQITQGFKLWCKDLGLPW